MKKSIYFLSLIIFIMLFASLVIAKKHAKKHITHGLDISTITHTTKCIVSKKVIILEKGQQVYTRSKWNFRIYVPAYRCFIPASSIK